jgi:hypothetical protein
MSLAYLRIYYIFNYTTRSKLIDSIARRRTINSRLESGTIIGDIYFVETGGLAQITKRNNA